MKRHFDAVVVGGGRSATLLAGLLAKRNVRGLLIDQGELSTEGSELNADLVFSSRESRVMERVHQELGIAEDLRVQTKAIDPTLQFIFPHERVSLNPERPSFLQELGRTFGPEIQRVRALLQSIDAVETASGHLLLEVKPQGSGFWERRRLDRALREQSQMAANLSDYEALKSLSAPLRSMLLSPLPFLSYFDCHDLSQCSLPRFARVLGRLFHGYASFIDGQGLRRHCLQVAERRGFEVMEASVESVVPKGREVQIQIDGSGELITADAFIDASIELSGLEMVPLKGRGKKLAWTLQAARPKGYLHTLALEVDTNVIPPGLGHHALLLNGRSQARGMDVQDPEAQDRPIWISTRPKKGEDDRTQILTHFPVPAVPAQAGRIRAVEESIRARVERLIPFLPEGNLKSQTVTIGRAGPQGRPVLPHPLFSRDLDVRLGLAGVPTRTPLKNVYVAGPAVLPGLGVEGDYLAALEAADACTGRDRGDQHWRSLALSLS